MLKLQLAFYDGDPERYPEEAPLYTRELLVRIKEGITFNTFLPQCSKISESIAEKGKDVGDTWTLGIAGVRGVDYVRVKMMEAWELAVV